MLVVVTLMIPPATPKLARTLATVMRYALSMGIAATILQTLDALVHQIKFKNSS